MSSWPTTSQTRPKTRSASCRYRSSSKCTAGEMSPSFQLARSRNAPTLTMAIYLPQNGTLILDAQPSAASSAPWYHTRTLPGSTVQEVQNQPVERVRVLELRPVAAVVEDEH